MPDNTVAPEVLSLDTEQVRKILLQTFGVAALELRAMQSELATVYRVDSADGRRLAFKASRYSDAELAIARWRTGAMVRLQERGVPVGRVFAVRADAGPEAGADLAVVETEAGQAIVQLTEWLEGTPLDSLQPSSELLRDVGRVAATVSEGLKGWPKPPQPIAHPWELTRTLETLAATMPAVSHDSVIWTILETAFGRFAEHVADKLPSLPHQVVHHDLHDSNLLVTGDSVTGVLDFGDMVWAPRVAELVVAGAYASRRSPDPVAALLDVVAGWGNRVPLTAAESDVVFDSVVARLAVNLSVWTARLASDRGEYAQARSAGVVPVLNAYLAADRPAVINEIRRWLGPAKN
ncbi:phosphotransferase [Gulosibacter chungangensis]|uniref:Hydroxylysine kinase n=1 Tax=Gulosibacter chungangensis TaxID=979746 RepID=A0A7J5BHD3_9MICO|nr:phosphotransferase [Gulosibacter chungangensis]KAB1645030.1 phosphotransferase [Gulosibacter chungangensis]